MRKPWFEFVPDFLDTAKADELLAWLNARQEWQKEDGYCATPERSLVNQHDSIQWGPRQAYLACVPVEFRIKSSGPIPQALRALHERVEQRYLCSFNSMQINRHYNERSRVHAHSDHMHGDIVMLSLGQERRFILRYKHDDKAKTLIRWKAGDIFQTLALPHGSLLTIYGRHQHDLTHELPEEDFPCKPRISVIWRYLTAADVEGPLHWSTLSKGRYEFEQAQAKWKPQRLPLLLEELNQMEKGETHGNAQHS